MHCHAWKSEIAYFVFFRLWFVDFETCLEKISKQLNFFLISRQTWALPWLVSWVVWKICLYSCWNPLSCCYSPTVEELTKSRLFQLAQQCFHCKSMADLKIAPSFVFLKKSLGAVWNLFVNSYHHVECFLWVSIHRLSCLIDGNILFRMKINLETIRGWFLVFYVPVPGYSQNGSGLYPDFRIQTKFFMFREGTERRALCLIEFLRNLLCSLALYLFPHLNNILLVYSRNGFVTKLFLGDLFRFFLPLGVSFLMFLRVAIHEGKVVEK